MTPDAFSERCLVSIQPVGGSGIKLSPIITSFSITGGEKLVESTALTDTSRILKFTPQSDVQLSFEAYTIGIGTTTGDDVSLTQHFNNPASLDTTQPLKINNSNKRKPYRVAILFTEQESHTDAEATPTSGYAERCTFANAYITSDNIDFTDYSKKQKFNFIISPFDSSASPNFQFESSNDCATVGTRITTLGAYTTNNKW
jgi:hypothetical protein